MLSLCTSNGISCGTWKKKEKTWTSLIFLDYKWLLCKALEEHHKAEESRAVSNEKSSFIPYERINVQALITHFFICNLAIKFSSLNKNVTIANPISKEKATLLYQSLI